MPADSNMIFLYLCAAGPIRYIGKTQAQRANKAGTRGGSCVRYSEHERHFRQCLNVPCYVGRDSSRYKKLASGGSYLCFAVVGVGDSDSATAQESSRIFMCGSEANNVRCIDVSCPDLPRLKNLARHRGAPSGGRQRATFSVRRCQYRRICAGRIAPNGGAIDLWGRRMCRYIVLQLGWDAARKHIKASKQSLAMSCDCLCRNERPKYFFFPPMSHDQFALTAHHLYSSR